jgi:predicted signal transduction protein with EAL and GGDEF domain
VLETSAVENLVGVAQVIERCRDMLDNPDDLAIFQGVIGLAGAFRRDVIAESVETIAHGNLLLQMGCAIWRRAMALRGPCQPTFFRPGRQAGSA